MSLTKPLVFVTGASGMLGYAIVYQLLEAGYPVRGSARGKKVEYLKKALAQYPKFEAVEIADVAAGDYSEIFKGIGAIIHTAAPVPGQADKETAFRSAVDGSLHVLKQAEQAGITRIVTTSSIVTYSYLDGPLTPDAFHPITKEEAFASENPRIVYRAQKKYADLAVLEYAKSHPNLDITMICPPYIFGPFAPGFEHILPEPDVKSFTSNAFLYSLLAGDKAQFPDVPGYIDIRDAARAHILALDSKPQSAVSDGLPKRLAIASPHDNDFKDALKIVAEERPQLRGRLTDANKVPLLEKHRLEGIDFDRLEEVISFKKGEFRTWKESVLDGTDSFIRIEETWNSRRL